MKRMTKKKAAARLMAVAFTYQALLLAYVHEDKDSLAATMTKEQAESLADEIQAIYHIVGM